jgi:hypothetical protein
MASGPAERVRELVASRVTDRNDDAYKAFMSGSWALGDHADAAIAAAREVFNVGTADERDAVADLVCRMDFEAPPLVHDSIYDCLIGFLSQELAGEGNDEVLAAIVYAFGHLYDTRCVPRLLELAAHDSAEVRHAVASSLPSATNYELTDQTLGVLDALVALSDDADSDVRDWAVFGLGSSRWTPRRFVSFSSDGRATTTRTRGQRRSWLSRNYAMSESWNSSLPSFDVMKLDVSTSRPPACSETNGFFRNCLRSPPGGKTKTAIAQSSTRRSEGVAHRRKRHHPIAHKFRSRAARSRAS